MIATLTGIVPGIIDSHIHQWDPFTTPRAATRAAPIYRAAPRLARALFPLLAGSAERDMVITPEHVATPYLPRTYRADAARAKAAVGVPVDAVVHIEADWKSADPVEETEWVEALPFGEGGAPRLAGIVAHADPRKTDFATTLERHAAASSRFRGIRCMTTWHPDPRVMRWAPDAGIMRSPDFLRGFQALADRGLTFDAYVYSAQLPDVVVLAGEYPDTTIVLDHYGPPVGFLGVMGSGFGRTAEERADLYDRWRDGIAAVAACPNVVAKHSGLAFPMLGLKEVGITRAALAEKVAPLVDHTTDVFGPDRILFGSNYPMDKSVAGYDVIVGALVDVLASRGEILLRNVFHDNALRVYQLT